MIESVIRESIVVLRAEQSGVDTTDVETVDHCILCGDSQVGSDQRFARFLALIPPYDVQRCHCCGLRWLSPRPTAAACQRLYAYDNYFSGPQAVEQFHSLASQRLPIFAARVADMESALSSRSALRMLDVGSATGEFVAAARARGHNAEGIEISDGARAMAATLHGVTLTSTPLEQYGEAMSFDVIHMNHVLEHLPDPLAALLRCRLLLRPGGLLVVEVPQERNNDLDRLRMALGLQRRRGFTPYSLHHTYFFSAANANLLMERAGFSLIRLATANPNRTPLRPFSLRNLLLRLFLGLSDRLHRGGNIIEIHAHSPLANQQ